MMLKTYIINSLAILTVLIFCVNIYGSAGDGGDAGAFLKNGIGVRPISMGKAFVAVADDANAGYWNPAGLAKLNHPEMSFMYSNPMNYDIIGGGGVKDIGYHTLSIAYPSSFGSMGLNVAYLSVGDIFVVKDATGPTGEKFQDKELGIIASYANSITEQIQIGLNLKFVRQSLWDKKGSGMGLDIGGIYEPMYNLTFGIMLNDIVSPKIKLIENSYSIPRKLTAGLSYKLMDDKILTSVSVDKAGGRSPNFHIGTEVSPVKDLFIRAGYTTDTGELSAGIGFRISIIRLDYGLGLLSLGSTHRLSFTMALQ
ncbi:TPA: PorV/PorQ family protein [Candidatus Poribacteria bacterium]|nr:PorV/PorQ family protein [Candidatus Poribacteria bacterium]